MHRGTHAHPSQLSQVRENTNPNLQQKQQRRAAPLLSEELLLVDLVLHGHSRSIIYLESDQTRLESKLKLQNKPGICRERENNL